MIPTTPEVADPVRQRLLDARIVMLTGPIDDELANRVCTQLLVLEAHDERKDIQLYINSPGGSVDAGFAIYDTMRYLSCDVATTCMGLAASMGQFILTGGTPGKRKALRHSRILMHQPHGQTQGTAADILIGAEQFSHLRRQMAERTAFHTGQTVERILADHDRDRWFTAEEALAYGMVDAVVDRRGSER